VCSICQSGDCSYYDRVRRQFTRSNMELRQVPSIWDLEDIVTFGQQTKVCFCFVLCFVLYSTCTMYIVSMIVLC